MLINALHGNYKDLLLEVTPLSPKILVLTLNKMFVSLKSILMKPLDLACIHWKGMCFYENYSCFHIEGQHLYRNKQTSVIIVLPKLDDSVTIHKWLQSSCKSCQDLLPTLPLE